MRSLLFAAFLCAALYGCGRSQKTSEGMNQPTAAHSVEDQQRRAAAARAALAQRAADRKTDPLALLELALFDAMSGSLESARGQLETITRDHPRFGRAQYHLGMIALQMGMMDEAALRLARAADLSPGDAQALSNASAAMFQRRQMTDARRYALAALKADDQFPDAHLMMARVLDEDGQREPALQHLESYIRSSPNPAPGYFLNGRIYARIANGPKAEEWLKKAAESDPQNPEIQAILGRVYLDLFGPDRIPDAVRYLSQALNINPDHASARYNLGRAHMKSGRNEEAAAEFQRALKDSPEPAQVHYDLGQTLLRLGRREEARTHLAQNRLIQEFTRTFNSMSRAIDRTPASAELRIKLAEYCVAQKQLTAAEGVLKGAIVRVPTASPLLYRKLAEVYERMGREDLATRARDEAYRKGNSSAP